MGEYGSGLTMGKCFNMDKERIKKALDGYLVVGEDKNGFIYEKASQEECREFILRKFDNAVYHCLESMAFGRVYDYIMAKNGVKYTMEEILLSKAIEDERFQDYQYEPFDGGE